MKKIRITEAQAKTLGLNINENDTESGVKNVGASIGEVVIRIVISGDKVETLKDRILQLITRQDPEARVGFFEATKKIVGNVKEIKLGGIKRDLTTLDPTITIEKKPISKSIKEGKKIVKITREQYDRLLESEDVKGGTNRLDKTFKKEFAGKKIQNLKPVAEDNFNISKPNKSVPKLNSKVGNREAPLLENEGMDSLKNETLELIKHLYRKSEELSPFWEKNGVTYDEICDTLLSKNLIKPKNGSYILPKTGGSPQSAVASVEEALNGLINKDKVSEPEMETETQERELNPPVDKNVSYTEPIVPKESKLECEALIEKDRIAILTGPDGKFWLFNYLDMDEKDFKPYASVLRTYVGNDDEGNPDYDLDDKFDMTPEVISHYVNDNLDKLVKGYGMADYGNYDDDGVELVEIDDELKQELLELYDKNKVISKLFGQIEEGSDFPDAWNNLKKSLEPVDKAPIDKDVIKDKLHSLKSKEYERRAKEDSGLRDRANSDSDADIEEMTGAASSGAFTGPLGGGDIVKREMPDVPVVGETTTVASAGNFQYDTPGLANVGRNGEFKKGPKTKAQSKTQYAGGSFVETSSCTKLNNNKEAQNGKCSQGAVDGVVKQKKTNGSIISPSLGENKIYEAIAKKTGKTINEVKEIITRKNK